MFKFMYSMSHFLLMSIFRNHLFALRLLLCCISSPEVSCGKNMQFMSAVSPCPNNCVERDAEANCDISLSREGCGCAEGFILDGNRCVQPKQCGCMENNIYYNVSIAYPTL